MNTNDTQLFFEHVDSALDSDVVMIKISDSTREVEVRKSDLVKIFKKLQD